MKIHQSLIKTICHTSCANLFHKLLHHFKFQLETLRHAFPLCNTNWCHSLSPVYFFKRLLNLGRGTRSPKAIMFPCQPGVFDHPRMPIWQTFGISIPSRLQKISLFTTNLLLTFNVACCAPPPPPCISLC